MKLVNAPTPCCVFDENMLTCARVRSVYQKIIDYHGRVEHIKLFDQHPPTEDEEETKESSKKKKLKAAKKVEGEDEEETKDAKNDAEKEDVPEEPKYKTYSDPSMTLFDIFGEWGCDNKYDLPERTDLHKVLWYDFKPYNSKDPVLLALMYKDPDTGRTI